MVVGNGCVILLDVFESCDVGIESKIFFWFIGKKVFDFVGSDFCVFVVVGIFGNDDDGFVFV